MNSLYQFSFFCYVTRKHCYQYPGILDDFSKLFYLHVDICRICFCFRTLPGASGNRTAETLL